MDDGLNKTLQLLLDRDRSHYSAKREESRGPREIRSLQEDGLNRIVPMPCAVQFEDFQVSWTRQSVRFVSVLEELTSRHHERSSATFGYIKGLLGSYKNFL